MYKCTYIYVYNIARSESAMLFNKLSDDAAARLNETLVYIWTSGLAANAHIAITILIVLYIYIYIHMYDVYP